MGIKFQKDIASVEQNESKVESSTIVDSGLRFKRVDEARNSICDK